MAGPPNHPGRLRPDRVAVLSLARRPDRLAAFRARLPADWPWPDPVTVPAIDGEHLELPVPWRAAGPGAYGCALTHLLVLARPDLSTTEVRSILILEDDAVFAPGFTTDLETFLDGVPSDWGMLMLGGQHMRPPATVAPGIVRCLDTQRTHAYLVRGSAIGVLADIWHGATGHIDHLLPLVQRQVPTYAPDPFLIGQAAGTSDITHGVEGERFWSQQNRPRSAIRGPSQSVPTSSPVDSEC
jgi:hypothetical protein